MSEQSQHTFACNQCGQSYTWMPQLVGKKVRCKCGNVMLGPEAGRPAVSLPAGAPTVVAPKVAAPVAPRAARSAPSAPAAQKPVPTGRSAQAPARPAAAAAPTRRAPAAAPPPPPDPAPEQDDFGGGFDDLSDDLYALAGEMEKAATTAPVADVPVGGYRCPGCGGDLPVGTVICGQCGFNFQTGTKGHAPAIASNIAHPGLATAAPMGTGRFGTTAPTSAPTAPKAAGGGAPNRKLIMIGGGAAAAVVVLVLGVMLIGGGDSAGASPAAIDQYAAKQAGSAQEARAWLAAGKDNALGMLAHAESQALVEELYDQGATEVKVAPTNKRAMELIVVLPSEKAARTKIFNWERQRAQKWGYEPDVDAGQKFLLVYPYYVEPPQRAIPAFTFPGATGTGSDEDGDDGYNGDDTETYESYDE